MTYDELGKKLIHLKKDKKKKTGGLNKVTKEKTSQPKNK